jgi:Swi5-dependent recombination DNA repair protein 1
MLKKHPAPDDHNAQSAPLTTAPSIDSTPSSPPPKLSSSPGPSSLPNHTSQTHSSLSSPTRPTAARKSPSILTKNPDLEYIALQKQYSALFLQLSQLRTAHDTSQQAVKIATSNTDVELESLISKWKTASREAAEELFRGARDRVNKMGGVGAWRERTKKQSMGGWGDENLDGDETNEDGSEITEAQKEARAIMLEEMKAEMGKYGEKKEEVEEEKDDESFTMDMMLKQLNIALDVIGYDKASQRWI